MRQFYAFLLFLLCVSPLKGADVPLPDTSGLETQLQTGLAFMRQARYDSAEFIVRACLDRLESSPPSEPLPALAVPYARLQNHLGDIYWRSGQYPVALTHLRTLLAWEWKTLGQEHLQSSWTDFLIGSVLWSQEAYDSSLVYLHRSLDLRQKLLEEDAPEVIACYNSLGYVYGQIGQYERALNYHQQALTYRISSLGPRHNAVAQTYNNMGLIYERMGNIPEALRCHRASLDIRQQLFPETHPRIATSYTNLGNVYSQAGDLALAAELLTKAHQLYRQRLGTQHPWVGGSLINIGLIYQRQGDTSRALATYQEAIRLLTLSGGPIQPSIAGTMTNIGDVYAETGQNDSALYWQQKALGIWQQTLGQEHPQASGTQVQIAHLFFKQKKYASAVQLLQTVLSQQARSFGALHPDLGRSRLLLSEVYQAQGNCEQALQQAQKAAGHVLSGPLKEFDGQQASLSDLVLMQALHREALIREACPSLSSSDAKPIVDLYEMALKVGIRNRNTYQREASQLTLQGDLQVIIADALRFACTQFARDEKRIHLERAYHISQQGKANLMYQTLRETALRSKDQLPAELGQALDALETDLVAQKAAVFRWAEIEADDSLQGAQDALFATQQQWDALRREIEKVSPAFRDLRKSVEPLSLAVIQQSLPLGAAVVEYVAGEHQQFVWVIRADTVLLQQLAVPQHDLEEAITQLREALENEVGPAWEAPAHTLYQMIWRPIQSFLPGRVCVIPDGMMGYLPFDLLLYEAGDADSYLARRHQLTYSYAPRFLPGIMPDRTPAPTNPRLLAVAPHFGAVEVSSDSNWLAGRTALQPLRYNEQEARRVHSLMGGTLSLGTTVRKSDFVEQAAGFDFIHIASHAAINDQQPNFSYVAFSPEAGDTESRLYLNEVFELELQAQLVVLSACETGVGTFYQGEGMASLARGFSIAGAQSVLTTLWKVDDAGSLRFMEHFYRQLRIQPNASAALYQTRLDFIAEGEHPYIWAAYVPSGDWEGVVMGETSFWDQYGIVLLIALVAGGIAVWAWGQIKAAPEALP